MRLMRLGHSGMEVSALALGCMYFGSAIDEVTSFELLDRYAAAGGSFLDSANNYAFWVDGFEGGESERTLGRWMKARRNREQMCVATKVGYNMPPRVPISLARKTILEQCEISLKNLQTDYIDLYYAHWDHRETPLEEILSTFDQLVQEGKVRYIGCSNMLAWRIEQARAQSQQHGWPEYCCVQQRHSYLRPKTGITTFANGQVAVNSDLLDYATVNANRLTVVAYSTLLGGVYSRPQNRIPDNYQPHEYDPTDMQARLKVLHAISQETGATPNQVVLAWMIQNTPAMIALISSSSPARLQESLNATAVTLTAEQLKRLNQAGG